MDDLASVLVLLGCLAMGTGSIQRDPWFMLVGFLVVLIGMIIRG